ncbi:hypothetical protein GIV52_25740 [Pseudomonas syringae]|uniref:Uncharacterized protein n=1 Tax=Pseudomonas syringae TaxID=317 RepID=A0A9Q4A295_PSESX|nr:hypothetical protein [Pseudomonas syringae]MCF5471891.1 hypothetical protein [Pseudomonas syringae]MCF5482868.1 hypothetical protein [Pseudomonas syringae]MCF5490740.1 hypothetical protein [Pseudomonas syringae]MCF5495462.1 hypothetical protein [Pseudomonas syringae]
MGRRWADSNVNSLKISTVYRPRKMAIAHAINAGGEFNSNGLKLHAGPSSSYRFQLTVPMLACTR